MADRGSSDCSCSNIAIMQLFYELKQRYSTVPDQIVSKVIQENCHDKNACEVILEQENRNYLQSYPGVIISGNSKENLERKPLCNHCPGFKISSSERKTSDSSLCTAPYSQTSFTQTPKKENAFPFSEDNRIYLHQPSGEGQALFNKCYFRKDSKRNLEMSNSLQDRSCKNETNCDTTAAGSDIFKNGNSNQDLPESNAPLTANNIENNLGTNYCDANSSTESRTCYSDCDSEVQSQFLERSHLLDLENDEIYNGLETVNDEIKKLNDSRQKINPTASTSQMPVHNYQVAVQYSMQPVLPIWQSDQQRSFTTVNLNVRPPTSEPQAPIEIQSGQNLTYTSSVFDAKKGVQSQFQIMIGLALLEQQRERKSLLARELSKEKEKLSHMQNEVRLMKASIAQKPSPLLLPKLKAEIERLRTDCERLTAAVDLYSDKQNILPLGETDEEFYRNIYTGQTLEKQGSWSCQLCTFRNHPLLNVCEECEMPRISLGTQVMDVASHLSNVLSNNNTSFCTGEGTSTSASLITAPLQDR